MPTPIDGTPVSRNHHDGRNTTLSHLYRDAQLGGSSLSLTQRADIARRFESPTFAYRDRGEFSLRRW